MPDENKFATITGGKPKDEDMCAVCESEWHSTLGCPYLESCSYDAEEQAYNFTFQHKTDDAGELVIFEGCFPRLDQWRIRTANAGGDSE